MNFNKIYQLLSEGIQYKGFNDNLIYTFYYLVYYWQTTHEKKSEVLFELNDIKDIYLGAFKQVIINQLIKYYDRRRLDSDSYTLNDLKTSTSYATLDTYMNATYRSDMKRRNTVWNNLTSYLAELEKAGSIDLIIFYIDRINNVCHNTGTSILDKFDNYRSLISAFDECHNAKNPKQFKHKTSNIDYLFENKNL